MRDMTYVRICCELGSLTTTTRSVAASVPATSKSRVDNESAIRSYRNNTLICTTYR